MIKLYFNGIELTEFMMVNPLVGVSPDRKNSIMEFANSDGAKFINSVYGVRNIPVKFAIKGDKIAGRRKLAEALNVRKPKKLVINNEPSLYWNAIPDGSIDWEEVARTGLGKIEFMIPDGVAHSLIPKTVSAVNKLVSTVCEGTYPSRPVLNATMNSDNGFLAFVNQKGAILQFGKTNEVDGQFISNSETLINDRMNGSQSGWTQNVANLTPWDSPLTQVGTTGHFNFEGTEVTNPTSYGTGAGWHGPSLTKAIPADSNAHVGAKNFELSFWHMFESGTVNDIGMCQFAILDETGRVITDLSFYKKGQGNNNGAFQWHVNGVVIKEDPFTPNYNNAYTSRGSGRSTITKFGDTITLTVGGKSYTCKDSALTNVEATKISWYVAKWGTLPAIAANYLMQMTFKKHNVDKWRDIPNRFANGDVVKIDVKENKIYKNGMLAYELDTLGNNWEEFLIEPGANEITCMYSSWAADPSITLEYEETYL